SAYQLASATRSLSGAPPGVNLLNAFDQFSGIRNALRRIASEREQWSGIPMPIEGMSLAIEPRYPNAAALSAIGKKPEDLGGATLRNSFIIRSKQLKILIWNELDGRLEWGKQTTVHHLDLDLAVIGASDAWGVEQEHNALMTLGTLIEHHKFKKYLLTGSFME